MMKRFLKSIYISVCCVLYCVSSACADEFDDARYYLSKQDYRSALPILEGEVRAGNPQAAQLLGLLYEFGTAVPQSYSKALDLYSFAAKNGSISANFNIGEIYFQGMGVDIDLKRHYFGFKRAQALAPLWLNFDLATSIETGLAFRPIKRRHISGSAWQWMEVIPKA